MRIFTELMYRPYAIRDTVWRYRSLGYKQAVIYGLAALATLLLLAYMYLFTLHQPDRGQMLVGNAWVFCGIVQVWLLAGYAERRAIKREHMRMMAYRDTYGTR